MSNSKTAIQEIKKLMSQFGFMSNEPTLKSFKLEDNTILETKNLKVGEKITKLNEEFERVALESGSYRLVENFNIEVKEGEIVAVKEIFLDAKLIDGTQIKVEGDGLLEGAKVSVITVDGEIPAPDGIHELEDGSKVETKEGVIVKIEESMEDVVPEAPVEEPILEDGPSIDGELLDMMKSFIKKLEDKMSSMEKKMESMNADFKAFKSEPAAKKISNGKTEFNKEDSYDSTDAKISAIMNMRKK